MERFRRQLERAGTTYADSSTATFPDSGVNTNITIAAGGVSPYHVNFTNASTVYSLSGGPIAGLAGITLSGGGLVKLNNTNSYAGATDINSGTLQIGQANALPTATGVLLGGANGVLDLHGNSQQIGSLSGPGKVTNLGAQNATLTVGGAVSPSAFTGAITNGPTNNISLTKSGSGTLTLAGPNTYSGQTIISNGTVKIGHSSPRCLTSPAASSNVGSTRRT